MVFLHLSLVVWRWLWDNIQTSFQETKFQENINEQLTGWIKDEKSKWLNVMLLEGTWTRDFSVSKILAQDPAALCKSGKFFHSKLWKLFGVLWWLNGYSACHITTVPIVWTFAWDLCCMSYLFSLLMFPVCLLSVNHRIKAKNKKRNTKKSSPKLLPQSWKVTLYIKKIIVAISSL